MHTLGGSRRGLKQLIYYHLFGRLKIEFLLACSTWLSPNLCEPLGVSQQVGDPSALPDLFCFPNYKQMKERFA